MNFLRKIARSMLDIDPRVDYLTGNEDLDSLLELHVLKEKIPFYSYYDGDYYYRGNLEVLAPPSDGVIKSKLLKQFFQRDAINIARCLSYKFLGMLHTVYCLESFIKCPGTHQKPIIHFRFGLPYSFYVNEENNFVHWILDMDLKLGIGYDARKNLYCYKYLPGECLCAKFTKVEVINPIEVVYTYPLGYYTDIYIRDDNHYHYDTNFIAGYILEQYLFHLNGRYFEKLETEKEAKCYLGEYEKNIINNYYYRNKL